MPANKVPERKRRIVQKLCECFMNFDQVVIVQLDNVSTSQIQNARARLREGEDRGEMVVGKNTLIHKAIDWLSTEADPNDVNYEDHKKWENKLPHLATFKQHVVNNVGLIFSKESYVTLREGIEAESQDMPAKAGVYAPCDVTIPKGGTGVDTGKIDMFHKMSMPVKVAKGSIELTQDFLIIQRGEKVTEAAAHMCRVLNMTPFKYRLSFLKVYMKGKLNYLIFFR